MDISEILDNYPAIIIVVVYVVIYGLKKWADIKSPAPEEADEDSKKAIDSAMRKIARRRAELNESRRAQESKANAEPANAEPLGRLERRELSERTRQEEKRHDREAIPNVEKRNAPEPRSHIEKRYEPESSPRMEKPWSPFGETTYEFEEWLQPDESPVLENVFKEAYPDKAKDVGVSDLKSAYETLAGHRDGFKYSEHTVKRGSGAKKFSLPRGEMRRAVVMSEILSKPVSMRERGCGGIKI